MRILLDTNILIYREDDHVLSNNMQELIALLHNTRSMILIHPASLEDLEKDKDNNRRQIMLSKVKTYAFLEDPPVPNNDTEYLNTVKADREGNERVDIHILYAVYKNAVDFLVTEDKGIHKKARNLGIDARVLFVEDAVAILRQYVHKDWVIIPPALKQQPVYNLNVDRQR